MLGVEKTKQTEKQKAHAAIYQLLDHQLNCWIVRSYVHTRSRAAGVTRLRSYHASLELCCTSQYRDYHRHGGGNVQQHEAAIEGTRMGFFFQWA